MHAFSVLLAPLEARLGSGRGPVSLIYAVGLLTLTLGVRVFGDSPIRRRRAPALPALVGVTAAGGLVLAAATTVYPIAFVGFALIFGFANGVGYAAALEISAAAAPRRSGMAMAMVTAAYAAGATIASLAMNAVVDQSGVVVALVGLAIALAVTGFAVSAVLRGDTIESAASTQDSGTPLSKSVSRTIWLAYGLSVIAGLMALGHAAELVRLTGASDASRQVGVTSLTVANAGGGAVIAILLGRFNQWRLLVLLPLASCGALISLAAGSGVATTIISLTIVGATYGAIIAVYPFAVFELAGPLAYPAAYGRVFTAWGFAGLAGPFLAGAIFDIQGSYRIALVVAALASVAGALLAYRIRP